MSDSDVEGQLERSRRRLASLREREGHGAASPLQEAVEELGHTLEELSVTLEELFSANQELAEAQLLAEEHARRYLDIFRFAPDAYVISDGRGVIRELNAVAEEKLGRPARHLVGKPLLPLIAATDRDAFLACLSALRERGRRIERPLRFGADPGFHATVSATPERRGDVLEIRWMLRDETARLRAEAALRASEARMRSLAQSLSGLIAYVDRDERYRFNNAAYQVWFGIPPEKLVGTPVRELLGDAAYAEARSRIAAVLRGEPQLFENELALGPGRVRQILVEYEPDVREDGHVAGFYALVTDVSPFKRAEREAREAEARVRDVLDATRDGILSTDASGRIVSVNPAVCRLFGYAPEELVGREAIARLVPRLDAPSATLSSLGSARELEGVRRDGSRVPIQVSIGEARPGAERTFVVTIRDLSREKTLESRLRAAVAAATVAEERERRRLAADLHDDVGQLLTLAGLRLGMLRSAARERELEADLHEVGELIAQAHRQTESLTFQLSPPVLHDVGLAAAVEWLAEEMARTYGLRVHVERHGEPPLDEDLRVTLFRAVRELLINVARHARTERATVRLLRDGDRLRVEVADPGVGFDPKRVKPGYGLFGIRERLRHLRGEIEIRAVPGDGTRVVLKAPLEAGEGGRSPP